MSKIIFKYELGSYVKSNVTDFQGTIVSRLQQLNGVNRYFLQPKAAGIHVPPGNWLDEGEIVVLKLAKSNGVAKKKGKS